MHTSYDLGGEKVDVGVFHFMQGDVTSMVIHKYSKRSFVDYFRIIYENKLFSLVSMA